MRVFAGGSKTLEELSDEMKDALDKLVSAGAEFLVGDCFGADRLIQSYLAQHNCEKVTVFASGEIVRNNVGDSPVVHVDACGLTGFEFYRQKDIAMAKAADMGLMFWDGSTKGTFCNIRDLEKMGKSVTVISFVR